MSEARPEPGAAPGAGPSPVPAVPRPAATVILLRDGEAGLEVLLARRSPGARFMPGAWVFPGGAVAAEDGPASRGGAGREGALQSALRAAAVRELREEVGIELPPTASLTPYSNWITPAEIPIRFDTWFFLAVAPVQARPRADGQEMVDTGWFRPGQALAASRAGQLTLVFPTIKHLEQLSAFAAVEELLGYARGREIRPVQPTVIGGGETARIVLPGEQAGSSGHGPG